MKNKKQKSTDAVYEYKLKSFDKEHVEALAFKMCNDYNHKIKRRKRTIIGLYIITMLSN